MKVKGNLGSVREERHTRNVCFCLDFPNIPYDYVAMATDIGTRIKRARERKRWTQRQLAEALKVDRKTIDNWENGRTSPRSSIGAIEEVLGMRLDAEPEPDLLPPGLRQFVRDTLPKDKAAVVEAYIEAALRGDPLPSERPAGNSEAV